MSMTESARQAVAIALLGGLLACAGCGGGETAAPATDGAAAARAARVTVSEGSDMVAAVSSGKGVAPIEVRFDLGAKPVARQPVGVVVSVTPVEKVERLQVVFQGGDGLTVNANGNLGPIDAPKVGTALTQDVTVTPVADGVYYLSAIALIEGDSVSVSRTFSIPIIVGATTGVAADAPATERASAGANEAASPPAADPTSG
jgi:hypothetical protein